MSTPLRLAISGVIGLAFLWMFPGVALALLSLSGYGSQEIEIYTIFFAVPYLIVLIIITVRRGRGNAHVPVATAGILLLASVAVTHWPLRLSFALEHKRLDALADILESGGTVATPQWVGPFHIRKAELNQSGMPCLWIYLDPIGYTGLARPRDGVAKGKYNDWSDLRLDDKWHLIGED